jgi:manganese transport protein
MEGYLSLRINPWVRRLITRLLAIIPALIVILIYGEEKVDALLVLSQVVLSLQLGFAIIPLIHFVSDKKTMGNFAISNLTKIAAWLIASVLIFLNLKMLVNEVMPLMEADNLMPKVLIGLAAVFFGGILVYIILHPYIGKNKQVKSILLHKADTLLSDINIPEYKKIAVALDFSDNDSKILSYAINQGKKDSSFLLLHIVESASAKLHGVQSDDYETRKDIERMESYVRQLKEKGHTVSGHIGYRSRTKEIVRIVKENEADLLVIGAHGHTGLKDLIYGETVNAVRHELKIPVLVVTL